MILILSNARNPCYNLLWGRANRRKGERRRTMTVLDGALSELKGLIPAVFVGEPMTRHTTWGVGGVADVFVEVETREELEKLFFWGRKYKQPLRVVGKGSNLLVSDGGVRGVVVRLRGEFEKTTWESHCVRVGGGVSLPALARTAAERGFAGFESFAGIPGTVGGGVLTNAGTPEGALGDGVLALDVLDGKGIWKTLKHDEAGFGYRSSSLLGNIVVSVWFQLRAGDKNDILSRTDFLLKRRAEKQPVGTKNCGSVFKNPPGDFAARLIERCGLKGARVGEAMVSLKHANFIENLGGASATDVMGLIQRVRVAVKEKFGVFLELEVWIWEETTEEKNLPANPPCPPLAQGGTP